MRRRLLLAIVAGLVGVLAFPPFGWWPLAFVSIAGVTVAFDGQSPKQGAWLGLAFGAGLFLPMLHWTSTYVGALPWLILVFSQTWYVALMGAAMPRLQSLRGGPVWCAAAWVAEEALRGRFPFGGFPWGRWAFSQSQSPLKWTAALGGAPLVTFAVGLVGALLGLSVLRSRWRQRALRLTASASVVVLAGLLWAPLHQSSAARTTTIAAIQGDVPDRGLEFDARRRQVLDNHVNQTLNLASQIAAGKVVRPSLVLWPENASDIDPFNNPDAAAQIQTAADAVDAPILVGALIDGPGAAHVTNAGLLWLPTSSGRPGSVEEYIKRHPVPFGEYIPLRSVAHAISSKVDLVPRDMIAGKGDGLFSQTPFPLGDVICFEVAYDSLVRSSIAAGAQLLVVQTNNATFGHSSETYQQLAMAQLRAVEHRRTVVQVATSGKSAIIDPNGNIVDESGALFTPDIMVKTVSLETSKTLATTLGAAPEWLIVAVAVLAACYGFVPRQRQRQRLGQLQGSAPDEPAARVVEPQHERGAV